MRIYALSLHDALPILRSGKVAFELLPVIIALALIVPVDFRFGIVIEVNRSIRLFRKVSEGGSPVFEFNIICVTFPPPNTDFRSEEHTSELQSLRHLVCAFTLFPYTTLFRSCDQAKSLSSCCQ